MVANTWLDAYEERPFKKPSIKDFSIFYRVFVMILQ